jgi:hypothetical protein
MNRGARLGRKDTSAAAVGAYQAPANQIASASVKLIQARH